MVTQNDIVLYSASGNKVFVFFEPKGFFVQKTFSVQKSFSVQKVLLRVRPDLNEKTFWTRKNLLNAKNFLSPKWSQNDQKWAENEQKWPILSKNDHFEWKKFFWTEKFFCESGQIWTVKELFERKTSFEPRKGFLRVRRNKLMNQRTLFPDAL